MATIDITINHITSNATAESKLEALRNAGVNVDNLFSMKGITGDETIARLEGGQLSIVPDDDPVFAAIMSGGTIPNSKLFRRWVMAQVFHMLASGDFTMALRRKGYRYQWKMLLEEYKTQGKLFSNADYANFKPRSYYFSRALATQVCRHYMRLLHLYIKREPVHRCKGVPYVKLGGKNIFVEDLQAKVFKPLETITYEIGEGLCPSDVYEGLLAFYARAKKIWMPSTADLAPVFIDAYKGVGAYFTMKNLILFHGARFANSVGTPATKEQSLAILDDKVKEYRKEGWRLFGVMKKLIADNHINIAQKIAEWRK